MSLCDYGVSATHPTQLPFGWKSSYIPWLQQGLGILLSAEINLYADLCRSLAPD